MGYVLNAYLYKQFTKHEEKRIIFKKCTYLKVDMLKNSHSNTHAKITVHKKDKDRQNSRRVKFELIELNSNIAKFPVIRCPGEIIKISRKGDIAGNRRGKLRFCDKVFS